MSEPYRHSTGTYCCACCYSHYNSFSFKGLCPHCRRGSNDPSQDVRVEEKADPRYNIQVIDEARLDAKDHS